VRVDFLLVGKGLLLKVTRPNWGSEKGLPLRPTVGERSQDRGVVGKNRGLGQREPEPGSASSQWGEKSPRIRKLSGGDGGRVIRTLRGGSINFAGTLCWDGEGWDGVSASEPS